MVSSLVLSQLYCILFTNFRFFGLRKLHKRLNRYDDASERIASSRRSKRSSNSSKRSSKSDELTESLLYDEELGNDEQSDDSDW